MIGDSVNLASRLMQAAEPGQLLIDRPTHERVRDTTIHDELAPIRVKGKSGPIDVWTVHAARDRPGGGQPAPATAQPLVGREGEVARARALATRALAGEGQIVCLTGEAGIGKTRLGSDIVRMAEDLGFASHAGTCRSHGTTTSYLVWRSIWSDLLELDTSLPIVEQAAQLTRRIARRDGGSGDRAPLLGPVSTSPCPTANSPPPRPAAPRRAPLRSLLLESCGARRGPPRCCRARGLPLDRPRLLRAARVPRPERRQDQPVLILVIARRTGRSVAAVIAVSAPSVNRPPAR